MTVRKCPGCGAPVSGSVCGYCGTAFSEERPPAQSPQDRAAPAVPEVQVVTPKRTLLDKILIFFGALWVLTFLAAATSLDDWWHPVSLIAALLGASPGIVLLLLGFRRKKQKVIVKGQEKQGRP